MNKKKERAVLESLELDGNVQMASNRTGVLIDTIYRRIRDDEQFEGARARGRERSRQKRIDEQKNVVKACGIEADKAVERLRTVKREMNKAVPACTYSDIKGWLKRIARHEQAVDEARKRTAEQLARLRAIESDP